MPQTAEPITITPRQLEVLTHIEAFQNSRCYSATMEELAAALNVSRPTVFEHIAALREKKLITQSNGRARCLHLTAHGKHLIDKARQHEVENDDLDEPPLRQPDDEWTLAGCVCAGYGIEAIEEPQPFSVTSLFTPGEGLFVLQVTGSSMKDAGIFNGDYIVCRSSATAENGQIVVALLNGQTATLKRFFRDRHAIRLQPANDAFEPILATDCRIRAVVVGVIRKLVAR